MIIDLILDRKYDINNYGIDTYNAHDFYVECMGYNSIFDGIADEITKALDYGSDHDIKKALCNYIINNHYNKTICNFIDSVNWIDKKGEKQ